MISSELLSQSFVIGYQALEHPVKFTAVIMELKVAQFMYNHIVNQCSIHLNKLRIDSNPAF